MTAQRTTARRRQVAPQARTAAPSAAPAPEAPQFRYFHDKVAPWVDRGTVYGFELREELVKPTIVNGESAICALAAVTTGSMFGITSGKRGHAFYFHPAFGVVDLGVLSEKPVAGGALVHTRDDALVGGWHGETGGLFRHAAGREFGTGQEDFYSRKDPVVPVALPDAAEGIIALAWNALDRRTYGVTTAKRLVSLGDDEPKARVDADLGLQHTSPALLCLPDGTVLGAGDEGELWQYRPGETAVNRLAVFAPCEKGKRYVAGVQSLLLSRSGLVYGGTSTDGFVFAYAPATRVLTNLGKPHRQSVVRCLAEGHDGLLYGIVQEPRGMAHLFLFDPERRAFEDLGVLNSFITVQWAAHSIGALCTGIHGEIFLGEDDTIGHLFAYYPPIPPTRGP
jgi:hypothetical protein